MPQTKLVPKAPADAVYKVLLNVQNLRTISKNEEVRFGERYECEYMGSSQFELGHLSQRIRDLAEFGDVGEIVVDGVPMLVLYDRRNFNLAGAEYAVSCVYDGQWRTQDATFFNRRSRREIAERRKQKDPFARLRGKERERNAWIDINHGIFWTWDRINIRGVLRNIRHSVKYMDEQRREKASS